MKIPISLFFLLALFVSASEATTVATTVVTPVFRMSLKEAEESALAHSPRVQAARADSEAATARAKSLFASIWPKISFDASYRYTTEVPTFSLSPAAPPVKFGDNKNYSYGPALSWLAWDSGALYNKWEEAKAKARSKRSDWEAAQRQLLLETRLDYFQVQLGLEQARLLADSLRLGQAQYKDISLRHKAGALSKLDVLFSHQEVLTRRRQLRQTQADLANALSSLFAVTGSTPPAGSDLPSDETTAANPPPETDKPTLAVTLDPLSVSVSAMEPAATHLFDESNPQLQSLSELIEASERSVKSVRAGHYPFLQVNAKTSRDYPNGPVRESIHQNTLGLVASLPLFEFGRVNENVAEQESLLESNQNRLAQTARDLFRDWEKAREQWLGLKAQQEIYSQSISETEMLQKLTYESYQAGQVTYLEVQSANLRVVESKVASARNDVQLLIQLGIMDSLSTDGMLAKE